MNIKYNKVPTTIEENNIVYHVTITDQVKIYKKGKPLVMFSYNALKDRVKFFYEKITITIIEQQRNGILIEITFPKNLKKYMFILK